MRIAFRDVSIGAKLNASFLLAGTLLFGAMTLFLSQRIERTLEADGVAELQKISRLSIDMIDAFGRSLETNVDRLGEMFAAEFPEGFALDTTATVSIGARRTPVLRTGKTTLNLNFAAVDKFRTATGGVATLFARDGEDFVRIATSLKTEAGERAIGTLLDRAHPAYAKVLAGAPYVGKARLFGRDYMTKYLPIKDGHGQIIGSLFVGLDFTDGLKYLKEKVRAIKVGATGYVYVLDAREGKEQGTLVIHPDKEGETLLDVRDNDGRPFIRDILASKTGTIRYPWKNVGAAAARDKIVAYEHYANWNWVVAAGSYVDEFTALSTQIRNLLVAGVAGALLLLVGIVQLGIRAWVARPLAALLDATHRVAAGDLTVNLRSDTKDEAGRLTEATRDMVDRLAHIIGEVRTSADALNGAAGQVSETAQSLSQASAEQAASVEETTASMTQMNESIAHNTENAKVTDAMAAQSSREAAEGGAAVKETVEAMQQIAGKIGIIDDIAYQTNLLALNAAIEAARAGEHGKGFAVVAAEVRKLAERSQVAAQEIGELAGSSVKAAEQAGQLLDQMVPNIRKTSDLVQEIAAASQEQSAGVGQINGAMNQLNKATQQNAAASEELAATAEEMGGQAHQLQELMSFFRIDAATDERST